MQELTSTSLTSVILLLSLSQVNLRLLFECLLHSIWLWLNSWLCALFWNKQKPEIHPEKNKNTDAFNLTHKAFSPKNYMDFTALNNKKKNLYWALMEKIIGYYQLQWQTNWALILGYSKSILDNWYSGKVFRKSMYGSLKNID